MKITGKPKSPIEFLEIAKTPENIRAYYQESLGPKLTSGSEAGSLLAKRVLYHLERYVPKRLDKLRRKYFIPGMPANVALMCVIVDLRHHRYISIDPVDLCGDVPEAVDMNRVLAMAIVFNLILEEKHDFSLNASYPVETVGLMDVVRRNLLLGHATGMTIKPVSEVDYDVAETVYKVIHAQHA